MKFGIFYEHQLPKSWADDGEFNMLQEALDQVVLADELGFDHAWEVEHHFLDEYSHSSAPEVFLAAAAARTSRIRLGHGIRQVIPQYNHPARTAEGIATLDLISDGRVDFGIGEGATRHEDICHSLQLFADEVLPEFKATEAERQQKKDDELAPFIDAALARKTWMAPLADDEIPVVRASVKKAQTSHSGAVTAG